MRSPLSLFSGSPVWLFLAPVLLQELAPSFLFVHAAHLRVFFLFGQSNMEGRGSMDHLDALLQHPLTKSTYQHWGTPGNYTQREDVYVVFPLTTVQNNVRNQTVHEGLLTVGFGNPHNQRFGPELEFGWVLGDMFDKTESEDSGDILLIKCAWGGASLAVDFRSPSSGSANHTECDHIHPCHTYPPENYGRYYRQSKQIIYDTLKALPQFHQPHDTFELSGLVWFQGWNDVADPRKADEYASNLANFIRDIRHDLHSPNLPVVIGEIGQVDTDRRDEHHEGMRRAMRNVTLSSEFIGNTQYVPTLPYTNVDGEKFDGDYHYFGRADTYFAIGRAFGFAMWDLMADYTPSVHQIKRAPTAPPTMTPTVSPTPPPTTNAVVDLPAQVPMVSTTAPQDPTTATTTTTPIAEEEQRQSSSHLRRSGSVAMIMNDEGPFDGALEDGGRV